MEPKMPVRPRLLVGGFVAAAALGGLSWGVLALSVPPSVPVLPEPPFILVATNAPHGSVWMNVTTSHPFSTESSEERIELVVEVLGETGTSLDLAFGGSLATADTTCAGAAFDMNPVTADRGSEIWDPLVKYLERRPGTGTLNGSAGTKSISREAAEAQADVVPLIASNDIVLADVAARTWRPKPADDARSFDLASARLTCSVNRSAFTSRWLYRDRFRAPDLVASSSSVNTDDLVKVMYRLEAASPQSFTTWGSTFDDTDRTVDNNGRIVATYSDDWWTTSRTGDSGIALNGGSVVWEPAGYSLVRSWARLAAGLFASVAVAVATATFVYWSRAWK